LIQILLHVEVKAKSQKPTFEALHSRLISGPWLSIAVDGFAV
jgi:hypothetical protein